MAKIAGPHNKLKLISDGTAWGTHLIDTETGEDLFLKYAASGVSFSVGIEYGVRAGDYATVTVEFDEVEAELEFGRHLIERIKK